MTAGVVIEVPKDNLSTEVVNNSKERHEYRFAKVFDRDARQEEVRPALLCRVQILPSPMSGQE